MVDITGTFAATESKDTALFGGLEECSTCLFFVNNQCRFYEPELLIGTQDTWADVAPTDWCASYVQWSPNTNTCATCFSYRSPRCQYNAPARIVGLETNWPLVLSTDWCGQWSDQRPIHGRSVSDFGPWLGYTPNISAGTGTFGNISGEGLYKKIGTTVVVRLRLFLITNGTAGTYILVSLPLPIVPAIGSFFEYPCSAVKYGGGVPVALASVVSNVLPGIEITDISGGYTFAPGNVIEATATYETPS